MRLWPVLIAGYAMILALCLRPMASRNSLRRPVSWTRAALSPGFGLAGLSFFMYAYDSAPVRVGIFHDRPVLRLALSVEALLTPHEGPRQSGRRLAGNQSPFSSSPFTASGCFAGSPSMWRRLHLHAVSPRANRW